MGREKLTPKGSYQIGDNLITLKVVNELVVIQSVVSQGGPQLSDFSIQFLTRFQSQTSKTSCRAKIYIYKSMSLRLAGSSEPSEASILQFQVLPLYCWLRSPSLSP